jgi:ferric-dicitrate binding protein FerR (iron transport regulator)
VHSRRRRAYVDPVARRHALRGVLLIVGLAAVIWTTLLFPPFGG